MDSGDIMSRNVTTCIINPDGSKDCPQSNKLIILGTYEDPDNTEGVEATFNQYTYRFETNNQIS